MKAGQRCSIRKLWHRNRLLAAAVVITVVAGAGAWQGLAQPTITLLTGWPEFAVAATLLASLLVREAAWKNALRQQRRECERSETTAIRLANILESTTDAIIEVDRGWHVTFMNERACMILPQGRTVVGHVLWSAYPELADTELGERFRSAMNANAACEFEVAGLPTGRLYVARAFPSRDGLAVFLQDITERKQADQEHERLARELEKERTLLKGVLAHLPSGVYAVAAPEGRLLLHNAAAERLIGHPVCLARSVGDYSVHGAIHPDETPYRPEDYPLARALLHGQTVVQEEMLYRRGDGRVTTFAVSAAPVRDANGHTLMAVSTFHDIAERKRMEAALRRSEERLALALTSAQAGTFDTDLRAGRLRWSEESYRMFGIEPNADGIHLETWFALIHPDDRDRVLAVRERVLRNADPHYDVEHRVLRPDGRVVWVSVLGRFVFGEDGTAIRASGLYIDITDRKTAEEALRRSEERLTLALASARAGTFDWNVPTGDVIWSPESYRIYGLSPEQGPVTRGHWLHALHPDDRERLLAHWGTIIAERRMDLQTEYRVVHPDGTVRWVMANGRVAYGEDGAPVRVVGLDIDVTERKRLEEALRHSQERLKDALMAARAATWDRDLRTGEVFWSEENDTLFGLPSGTIASGYELWLNTVLSDDRDRVDRAVGEAVATRQDRFQIEFRIEHPDFGLRWLNGLGRILYGANGAPERMFGLNVDITERKRMEEELRSATQEAERASVAKSQFLAAASHDLRQPLQALFLFAAVLRDQVHTDHGRKALATLEQNLEVLKGLLDSLLDVSRLDAEVILPNRESFAVAPLFDQIGASFAPVAQGQDLDLCIDASRGLVVHSDRHLLDRMLRNLLENAIKYTERGAVSLACRVVDGRARFEVSDTGIGIPPDELDAIFVEFHQVNNPERDRTKGLGLGLAIVQRLAKLLDHPVSVQSTPGQGSVFAVDVPLGAADAVAPPEPFLTHTSDGGGRLVVLIDDEPDVLRGLQELFCTWGYDTAPGTSPEQALQRLQADGRTPVCVISDYRLGNNRTGVDAVRLVREQAGTGVPGMILSGDTGPDLRAELAAHGLDIVVKPIAPRRLHEALRRLLGEATPLTSSISAAPRATTP